MDELENLKHELRKAGDKYIQNLKPGEAAVLLSSKHGDILAHFTAGAAYAENDDFHLPRCSGVNKVKVVGFTLPGYSLDEFVLTSAAVSGLYSYFMGVEVHGIVERDQAKVRAEIAALAGPGDFVAIASTDTIDADPVEAARWMATLAAEKGAIIVAQTDADAVHPVPDGVRVFRMHAGRTIWCADRQLTTPLEHAVPIAGTVH